MSLTLIAMKKLAFSRLLSAAAALAMVSVLPAGAVEIDNVEYDFAG